MNSLRTAFWVIIAVALALFTKANWIMAPNYSGYVPVKLWGDLILETRLPVLIIAAFLLGLVPTWLWARAVKWQMRRRLASAERALANSVASTAPASASDSAGQFAPSAAPADVDRA